MVFDRKEPADEWEPGEGRGDDKIMRDKIIGPEPIFLPTHFSATFPFWSALGMDQLSDGGDSVLSGALQSALVWSGSRP